MFRPHRALLLLPVLLAGCQEEPSYFLRWKVTDHVLNLVEPEGAEDLTSVLQCSSVGFGQVELTTFVGDTNVIADQRIFPCFPDSFHDVDAKVGGPELEPGEYTVLLAALRESGGFWERDFPGGTAVPESWLCLEEPDIVSCLWGINLAELTVEEDQPAVTLEDLVLLAPPQCDDGVDNDQDGLVDLADPACLFDPLAANEIDDTDASLISFDVTFLEANPTATCIGLGISRIIVELDKDIENPIIEQACATPVTELAPFLGVLEPGEHQVDIFAVEAGTEDTPATVKKTFDVVVSETEGAFFRETVDFGPDDFLEVIEKPVRFKISYQATSELIRQACGPEGNEEGELCIEEFEVTALQDDQPLALTWEDFTGDCKSVSIQSVEEVIWAGMGADHHAYSLEVKALGRPMADPLTCPTDDPQGDPDAVCYETDDAYALAPELTRIVLPRVLDDEGMPPAGCQDCDTDQDCGEAGACVGGVCNGDG
jgi:hypothetical protein